MANFALRQFQNTSNYPSSSIILRFFPLTFRMPTKVQSTMADRPSSSLSPSDEEEAPFLHGHVSKPSRKNCLDLGRASVRTLLHASLFFFVCSILILIVAMTKQTWSSTSDEQCYEKFNVPCKCSSMSVADFVTNLEKHLRLRESSTTKPTLPTPSHKKVSIEDDRRRNWRRNGRNSGKSAESAYALLNW